MNQSLWILFYRTLLTCFILLHLHVLKCNAEQLENVVPTISWYLHRRT